MTFDRQIKINRTIHVDREEEEEERVMTTLDVSVVICAYTEERWQHLVLAVESVQRQEVLPREIIVVIDYNTSLYERARTNIPGITVLENSGTKGISGARSTGVAEARGGFIACLDDDATAEPGWLEKLGTCCADPTVLGVVGTVQPRWEGTRPRWFPEEFYWVVGCSYQTPPTHPVEVRNLWAGCMCVRREVFEAVGGFRSDIGHIGKYVLGGEETEFCIRAKQHYPHKKFLYEPQASIYHFIPTRRATWNYFLTRCYAEGLSKAIITRHVGAKDSLSSESSYILKVLPQGIARSLADCCLRRDLTGLQRAGAILVGLATTTAGYLMGTLARPVYIYDETHVVTIKKVAPVEAPV